MVVIWNSAAPLFYSQLTKQDVRGNPVVCLHNESKTRERETEEK